MSGENKFTEQKSKKKKIRRSPQFHTEENSRCHEKIPHPVCTFPTPPNLLACPLRKQEAREGCPGPRSIPLPPSAISSGKSTDKISSRTLGRTEPQGGISPRKASTEQGGKMEENKTPQGLMRK